MSGTHGEEEDMKTEDCVVEAPRQGKSSEGRGPILFSSSSSLYGLWFSREFPFELGPGTR